MNSDTTGLDQDSMRHFIYDTLSSFGPAKSTEISDEAIEEVLNSFQKNDDGTIAKANMIDFIRTLVMK